MNNKETQTVDVILNPAAIADVADFEERRKAAFASQRSDNPTSFESVLQSTQYGGELGEDSDTNAYEHVADVALNMWAASELNEQDEILDATKSRINHALGAKAAGGAFDYVVTVSEDGSVKTIVKRSQEKATRAWDSWKGVKSGTMPANTRFWRGENPLPKNYSEAPKPKVD
jgi:hypothetical protein